MSNRQPPKGTKVNSGSPLGKNITAHFTFTDGFRSSVKGRPGNAVSTGPYTYVDNGVLCAKSPGYGSVLTDLLPSTLGVSGSSLRSYVLDFDMADYNQEKNLFSLGDSSTGQRTINALQINSDYRGVRFDTYGVDLQYYLHNVQSTGFRVFLVITYDGGTTLTFRSWCTMFSTGEVVANSQVTILPGPLVTGNTAPLSMFGGGAFNWNPTFTPLYHFSIYGNRCLTQAECLSLYRNRHQVMEVPMAFPYAALVNSVSGIYSMGQSEVASTGDSSYASVVARGSVSEAAATFDIYTGVWNTSAFLAEPVGATHSSDSTVTSAGASKSITGLVTMAVNDFVNTSQGDQYTLRVIGDASSLDENSEGIAQSIRITTDVIPQGNLDTAANSQKLIIEAWETTGNYMAHANVNAIQNGVDLGVIGGFSPGVQTDTANINILFDGSIFPDRSGANISFRITQDAGHTGPLPNRSFYSIGYFLWEATYIVGATGGAIQTASQSEVSVPDNAQLAYSTKPGAITETSSPNTVQSAVALTPAAQTETGVLSHSQSAAQSHVAARLEAVTPDTVQAVGSLVTQAGQAESISPGHSQTASGVTPTSLNEAVGSTDAQSALGTLVSSQNETTVPSHSQTAVQSMGGSQSETVTGTDTQSSGASAINAAGNESASPSDSSGSVLTANAIQAEPVTATESESAINTSNSAQVEAVSGSEVSDFVGSGNANVTESAVPGSVHAVTQVGSTSQQESLVPSDLTQASGLGVSAQVESAVPSHTQQAQGSAVGSVGESAASGHTDITTAAMGVAVSEPAFADSAADILAANAASVTEAAQPSAVHGATANMVAAQAEPASPLDDLNATGTTSTTQVETASPGAAHEALGGSGTFATESASLTDLQGASAVMVSGVTEITSAINFTGETLASGVSQTESVQPGSYAAPTAVSSAATSEGITATTDQGQVSGNFAQQQEFAAVDTTQASVGNLGAAVVESVTAQDFASVQLLAAALIGESLTAGHVQVNGFGYFVSRVENTTASDSVTPEYNVVTAADVVEAITSLDSNGVYLMMANRMYHIKPESREYLVRPEKRVLEVGSQNNQLNIQQ
jgi:hypothetical protein